MARALAAACLLAACARAPEPLYQQAGVLGEGEPVVRVHLRSLGDWEELEVTGKDGLRVTEPGHAFATHRPYRLRRDRGAVRLRPLGGLVTVGGHTYAGELALADGHLVNRVTLENYVLGVLRGELPLKEVPVEAAGAQAIAVRSYTLHYLAQGGASFDLDDTTLFQRYVGVRYAPDDDRLRAGVQGTIGLYLSLDGRPLKAYYHSTCGGHTTDVRTGLDREPVAALRGVPCRFCEGTKYWRWETTLPGALVVEAAALEGPLRGLAVAERGAGERPRRLTVVAGGGSRTLHANELRLRIGPSRLRSTNFTRIEPRDGGLHVEGGGWGHGVGMCQMGAIGMARQGGTAAEIAAYYYPGATLRRAY